MQVHFTHAFSDVFHKVLDDVLPDSAGLRKKKGASAAVQAREKEVLVQCSCGTFPEERCISGDRV